MQPSAGAAVVKFAAALLRKALTSPLVPLDTRMGQGGPRNDRPNERQDAYFREGIIDLEKIDELLPGLRVEVRFLPKPSTTPR